MTLGTFLIAHGSAPILPLAVIEGPIVTGFLTTVSSGRPDGGRAPRIWLRYSMNFVWATFLRRLFTEEWVDVRPVASRTDIPALAIVLTNVIR